VQTVPRQPSEYGQGVETTSALPFQGISDHAIDKYAAAQISAGGVQAQPGVLFEV
jgi:hypothetical protein